MKVYRYQKNWNTCIIFEAENSAEIWISLGTVFVFKWSLIKKPANVINWFLDVIMNNIDICVYNFMSIDQIKDTFMKNQLIYSLQEIATSNPSEFYEYICTRS